MAGKRAVTRVLVAAGALAVVLQASGQAIGPDPLRTAREEVQAELVKSFPASLPGGPVAILPPRIDDREAVDGAVVEGWGIGMAETLHRLRPEIAQTDREHLTDILREQKFGDSAYADPAGAVAVGKLAAARVLLLTRLGEFRLRGGRIRVVADVTLVDVETGRNLWAKSFHRGIFPFWAKVLIGLAVVLAVLAGVGAHFRRRRTALVEEALPRAKAEARVDVDGLARSAADARERLQRAGLKDAAALVQRSWVDLDAVLDRIRHSLPGGSVDGSRVRDLTAAVREAGRMAALVGDLRRECDAMEVTSGGAEALVRRIGTGAADLRSLIDGYRSHLV